MLSARFFGYRYLGDGGTDRREILPDGAYVSRMSSTILEEVPQDPQIRNLCTPVWRVLCFANALVIFYIDLIFFEIRHGDTVSTD